MTAFIAREPVDLLAVVPYAIGFHPEESAVLLTFSSDMEQSAFHARVDLPAGEAEQRATVTMLRELVARRHAEQAGLILYTEDAVTAEAFAARLVPELVAAGVEVVDVLRVAGDRYFAGDDPEDPGRDFDLGDHPLTLARVSEGRIAHASRADLAASLIGEDGIDREAVHEAADRVAEHLVASGSKGLCGKGLGGKSLGEEIRAQGRWLQWRIRTGLAEPEEVSTADAGRILLLVALDSLRDVAWAEMNRNDAYAHVRWWRGLLRRAPDDLRATPAALLAFAAWLDGQGALAWCALDRCFEIDAGESLGQQVAALLESATPPTVWSQIPQSALGVFEDPGAVEVEGESR